MNQPNIGTYAPGTPLTVGSHQCKVLKYITSGGYAQVYSAEMFPTEAYSDSNTVCLKRVIVPDKPSLNTLRAEVDAMKLLKNRRHVVSYIDSHAAKSSLQNGSYEVFLLMEFCAGGGLIDFMNTRLQNRLQEFEILNIMSQVTQGIAAMHALMPPLIHRDIKIENVLISQKGEYKVCDFGSVCGVIRPPKNPQEMAYVQHDIMKSTTAQYRAPEMIDLYRGLPIDEKSDIWALGVFLYKLCYYTTPFEKGGELAILHSRYEFPAQPIYSDRMKNLIRTMLMESPTQRPNVCQILEEVSRMQGVPCPVRNFYLLRAMEASGASNNKNNNVNYQLHYSKTQPILSTGIVPTIEPQHINVIPALQAGVPNFHYITPTNTLPTLMQPSQTNPNVKDNRFVGVNKAVQQVPQQMSQQVPHQVAVVEPVQNYNLQKHRSAPSDMNILPVSPEKSGRGKISQIVGSNPTSLDRRTLYVDSETQTGESISSENSTSTSLELKMKAQIPTNISSSQPRTETSRGAPIGSRNGTSPVSFGLANREKSNLELIKDDSSLVAASRSHARKKTEDYLKEDSPEAANKSLKKNIQRRVHNLLNSSEESIGTIKNGFTTEKRLPVHRPQRKAKSSDGKSKPPPLPPKPAHLRPKKPPKPSHLAGKKTEHEEHDEIAVMDSRSEKLVKDIRRQVPSSS